MPVTFEVETADIAPLLAGLKATPRQITAIVKTVMQRGMLLAERIAKDLARTRLRVRTGFLIKAIRARVESDTDAVYGLLGIATTSDRVLVYAAVQELGSNGPIRAKNAYRNVPGGPYLNIPLDAALTPAGVTRFSAREAESVYPGGTVIAKSKKGNWILFGKLFDRFGRGTRDVGKGRVAGSGSSRKRAAAGYDPDLVPLFVLKKEVPPIPPKYFLLTGIEEVLPYIADAIAATAEDRLLLQGGPA